jgi:hypothetical protein
MEAGYGLDPIYVARRSPGNNLRQPAAVALPSLLRAPLRPVGAHLCDVGRAAAIRRDYSANAPLDLSREFGQREGSKKCVAVHHDTNSNVFHGISFLVTD